MHRLRTCGRKWGRFLLVLCFGKTWHHRLHANELFADKRNDISLGLGPIFWMKQSEEEQAFFRKRGISWTRGILLTCFDSAESRRWKDVTWLCFFLTKELHFFTLPDWVPKMIQHVDLSKHSKISQVIGLWFMIQIFRWHWGHILLSVWWTGAMVSLYASEKAPEISQPPKNEKRPWLFRV